MHSVNIFYCAYLQVLLKPQTDSKEDDITAKDKFIYERLTNKRDKSFYDPFYETFHNHEQTNKKYKCKDKVVTLQRNKEKFCKLVIITQKRPVDVAGLFKYPLCPLSLVLSECNGTLKKTVKVSLLYKKDIDHVTTIIDSYAFITYGLSCVRQLKVSKLTYANVVIARHHDEIYLITGPAYHIDIVCMMHMLQEISYCSYRHCMYDGICCRKFPADRIGMVCMMHMLQILLDMLKECTGLLVNLPLRKLFQ